MTDDRVWVTTPMTPEMRERIRKAAARNELTVAEYMRRAIRMYMVSNNEWSLRGPRKGST